MIFYISIARFSQWYYLSLWFWYETKPIILDTGSKSNLIIHKIKHRIIFRSFWTDEQNLTSSHIKTKLRTISCQLLCPYRSGQKPARWTKIKIIKNNSVVASSWSFSGEGLGDKGPYSRKHRLKSQVLLHNFHVFASNNSFYLSFKLITEQKHTVTLYFR